MNAFNLVSDDGRVLRLEQRGLDLVLLLDGTNLPLGRRDRLDLARFLLSGVTTLEDVVERLSEHDHLFEPLPEPHLDAPNDSAPAEVTDEHRFSAAPTHRLVIRDTPVHVAWLPYEEPWLAPILRGHAHEAALQVS